jgi:hypothetical protein
LNLDALTNGAKATYDTVKEFEKGPHPFRGLRLNQQRDCSNQQCIIGSDEKTAPPDVV